MSNLVGGRPFVLCPLSSVLSFFSAVLLAFLLLSGAGCDRLGVGPASVTITNVVETVREVVVTNTVTVTNVAGGMLTARRTAPYVVIGNGLDGERMCRLLSGVGARVITCESGAMALVEAPVPVVEILRVGGVVNVFPLRAEDKVAADAGEHVRILPLSSIDLKPLAEAIRGFGGEVVQVMETGAPAIRARLSYAAIRKLAGRGDVRKIERDDE